MSGQEVALEGGEEGGQLLGRPVGEDGADEGLEGAHIPDLRLELK